MAEEDPRPANLPFAIPVPNAQLKTRLFDCRKHLEFDYFNSLCLCKIKICNGDYSSSFSNAFCDVSRLGECFDFASFFHPGINILTKYLNDVNFIPPSIEDGIALEKLFRTIEDIDNISKKLNEKKHGHRQETTWVKQLVHHLLRNLAVKQDYVMNNREKDQMQMCGHTSMGNQQVWHGSADVLMGENTVVVDIVVDDADEAETDNMNSVSFENMDETLIERYSKKVFAKAIVFAFLRKKIQRKRAQNFLIPTIAISKKEVMFVFYDAKRDYLLKSSKALPLFNVQNDSTKLNLTTVLTLWLTINYPITCSGLTDKVEATDFKADFFKGFTDDIKLIYENRLRFGDCNIQYEDEPVGDCKLTTGGKPVDGIYASLEEYIS